MGRLGSKPCAVTLAGQQPNLRLAERATADRLGSAQDEQPQRTDPDELFPTPATDPAFQDRHHAPAGLSARTGPLVSVLVYLLLR